MTVHAVTWQSPRPLWGRFGATPDLAATAPDQARPAILRFASDDFMDQMLGTLARDPARVSDLLARPETWRVPAAERADLIERTPVPALTQTSMRRVLGRRAKSRVAAVAAEAEVREKAQTRRIPLKLYQPAHQRHYLVTASLVCGLPGFPERALTPGSSEQVNFVLRRLLPAAAGGTDLREFAFVKDAQGARWQRVADGAEAGHAVAGEELLPVFPLAFQDEGGARRRFWGGIVPVSRREEYVGASVTRTAAPPFAAAQQQALDIVEPSAPLSKMARVTQFQMEVAEPWKNLIRSAFKMQADEAGSPSIDGAVEDPGPRRTRRFEFNLQQQHASWLILLDFADYLDEHLNDVWTAIANNGAGASVLPPHRRRLYDWLGDAVMEPLLRAALRPTDISPDVRTPATSLRAALLAIRAPGVRERLERTELTYTKDPGSVGSPDWPPFHFVLAGLHTTGTAAGPFLQLGDLGAATAAEIAADPLTSPNLAPRANDVDRLTALVGRALEATRETNAPPLPFALQVKNALTATAGDAGWFVMRFVYQRRDCGPLHPPVLSPPTARFQLASFFDPDAPARPIRIALPLDTSPAGLRKFNKNTAFVLSDMLCGQVQRAKGLGCIDLVLSVLPWPLHKPLNLGAGGSCSDGSVSLGMICSLSIPIITICALILLMIIVSLLDMVFRWLPFFIMCFPLPRFKGKP